MKPKTIKCDDYILDFDPSKTRGYCKYVGIDGFAYVVDGKLHSEKGPAIVVLGEHGSIVSEHYYIDNKLHRDNAPAILEYDCLDYAGDFSDNLVNCYKFQYCQNGEMHRDDGPASISYFKECGIKINCVCEVCSIIETKPSLAKKKHLKILEFVNSNKLRVFAEGYFKNGLMHRDNGPAHIEYCTRSTLNNPIIFRERYYRNNVSHREDGAAETTYHPNGSFDYERFSLNGTNMRAVDYFKQMKTKLYW